MRTTPFVLAVVPAACRPAMAAGEASASRGRAFTQAHCAGRHALGLREASPVRAVRPFRGLARTFPVDDLADVLVEGVERRRPALPDVRLDPADAVDLSAHFHARRP